MGNKVQFLFQFLGPSYASKIYSANQVNFNLMSLQIATYYGYSNPETNVDGFGFIAPGNYNPLQKAFSSVCHVYHMI